MLHLGSPFSKPDLLHALKSEHDTLHLIFGEMDNEMFFNGRDGAWSPAENLVHLIISASPVIRALGTSKLLLRFRFGSTREGSRPLEEVRQLYHDAEEDGLAIASGGLVPQIERHDSTEKAKILDKWLKKGRDLHNGIETWNESQLDRIQLPHPILGQMTVREVILFTIYHNQHHLNQVEDLLGRPKTEWFSPIL